MNFNKFYCFVLLAVFCIVSEVSGHGRLMDPPSRSSMWRFGYGTPENYNDNELFCGGLNVQWQINHGKCGVCGDAYHMPQPRANEAGGKYGKGIIVKWYKRGQVMDVIVDLTANHRGYFEFKLCPHDNPGKIVSEECLNQYPLPLADGSGYRYYVPEAYMGHLRIPVQLPANITCAQCVFRWQYRGENNWGICKNGTQGLGCGPQETFRACADIAIMEELPATPKFPFTGYTRMRTSPAPNKSSRSVKMTKNTTPVIKTSTATSPGSGRNVKPKCKGIGVMRAVPGLSGWCDANCKMGHCPKEICQC